MADLAALVASPWWKWQPGMVGSDQHGRRWRAALGSLDVLVWDIEGDRRGQCCTTAAVVAFGLRPDVDNPATRGWLLEMAREAWEDPMLFARREFDPEGWVAIRFYGTQRFRGPTEPAALIAAILAAPPPGVDRG